MSSPERLPILIVDDEPSITSIEKQALETAGYRTEVVDSGKEALRRIELEEFSLVLLDYALPDIKGNEIVEALGHRLNTLPVVMVTGHGDERLASDMLRMGVADYLIKGGPNFVHSLTRVVEITLARFDLAAESRALQAQLLDISETFRKTFEAIPDPTYIWELKPDDRVILTQTNQPGIELFNIQDENPKGAELEDFYMIDPEMISIVRRTFQTGETTREERMIQLQPKGEEKCLNVDYVKFKEDGVLVMIKDITQHKLTETKLKKIRDDFEFLVADQTSDLLEANKKFQESLDRYHRLIKNRE
ncbi:response regulator [bacterium]|nr:response regulator [bacterium]